MNKQKEKAGPRQGINGSRPARNNEPNQRWNSLRNTAKRQENDQRSLTQALLRANLLSKQAIDLIDQVATLVAKTYELRSVLQQSRHLLVDSVLIAERILIRAKKIKTDEKANSRAPRKKRNGSGSGGGIEPLCEESLRATL